MQQAQAAQFDFGEENGVAKIVGFDFRQLAVDPLSVGAENLLLDRLGGLGKQFVDLALVENVAQLVVWIVSHR